MSNRPMPYAIAERPFKSLQALAGYIHNSHIEAELVDLVQTRISQIHGCAYCIDMHIRDLRKQDVEQRKIDLLPAWREADIFSDREKAAFAWSEYLTRLAETAHVPDEVYNAARAVFTEEELVDLTWVVTTINTWNRFNVAFQVPAGEG